MSALVLALVATAGGIASILLEATRPRLALAVGLGAAAAAVVVASAMGSGDGLTVGGTLIAGSGGLRAVALAWAGGLLLIGALGAVLGIRGGVVGPALVGLGAAALALGNADAVIALTLLTAGGAFSVVSAVLGSPTRPEARGVVVADVAWRALRAVTLAGGLAYLTLAWGASPAGPLGAVDPLGEVDPAFATAAGIALVAIAAAVAVRSAAIPAHLWGARVAGAASPAALPAALGWGAAAFAITALGWIQVSLVPMGVDLGTERAIVALAAVASIVLGGAAALLHDDPAHVLGYSLVQDAGLVLLAFASVDPATAVAAREWILGMAAVKTALAAWIVAIEAGFPGARLSGLTGWARRRPLLGLGFGVVLVGAVGLPGMATFSARGILVNGALDGPVAAGTLLAAFLPIAYLGRILAAGFRAPSPQVASGDSDRPDARPLADRGWTGRSIGAWPRIVRAMALANRAPVASLLVLATAALGLAVAASGPGSVAFGPAEGGPGPVVESPAPTLPG